MHDRIELAVSAETHERLATQARLTGRSEEQLAVLALHAWLHSREQLQAGARAVIVDAVGTDPGTSSRTGLTAVPGGASIQFTQTGQPLPTWYYEAPPSSPTATEPRPRLQIVRDAE